MKVAIFGASGFVGRNVVEALKKANIETVASDIQDIELKEVDFVKADILDHDAVSRVVKDSDVIIHLVASPLPVSLEKPKMNARINIEGTLNVMDVAREHGVDKIIYFLQHLHWWEKLNTIQWMKSIHVSQKRHTL